MSEKLTVSVRSLGTKRVVRLAAGGHTFLLDPTYPPGRHNQAEFMAEMLASAIAAHDRTILAQRDRLLEACKRAERLLFDGMILSDPQKMKASTPCVL